MKLHICGLDEIEEFRDKGITHVLSLLNDEDDDPDHIPAWLIPGLPIPPSIADVHDLFESFDPHVRVVLRFDDVTIPTRFFTAPTAEDVEAILAFGKNLSMTDNVLVHCHAGVSRSTAAAALILLQAYPEKSAIEIFERILRIRPIAVPNQLILELGGYTLGRKEEILEAVKEIIYEPAMRRRLHNWSF